MAKTITHTPCLVTDTGTQNNWCISKQSADECWWAATFFFIYPASRTWPSTRLLRAMWTCKISIWYHWITPDVEEHKHGFNWCCVVVHVPVCSLLLFWVRTWNMTQPPSAAEKPTSATWKGVAKCNSCLIVMWTGRTCRPLRASRQQECWMSGKV